MVKNQIEKRGIKNPAVIQAMQKVKRHLFVPGNLQSFAYADYPLPIGENQTISQPYIVALMTELAEINPSDKALEIGTGSGYQAAILAELCQSVYTIEINPVLAERAKGLLNELGYRNIFCKTGDGYQGWSDNGPFDVILVTCAPLVIPDSLIRQLNDNGRMVIPVGPADNQNLVVYRKIDNHLKSERIIPVRFVPMVDEAGQVY